MSKPTNLQTSFAGAAFASVAGQRKLPNSGKWASGFNGAEYMSPRQLNALLGNGFDWDNWLDSNVASSTVEISAASFTAFGSPQAPVLSQDGTEWTMTVSGTTTRIIVAPLPMLPVGITIPSLTFSIAPGSPSGGANVAPLLLKRAAGGSTSTVHATTITSGSGYSTYEIIGGTPYTVAAGDRLSLQVVASTLLGGSFGGACKFDGVKMTLAWP